ncbi:hypothetical protein [Xanthomonas euroxanthea]|nr:hypothetical protein [Xanthomonas euroxanthea]
MSATAGVIGERAEDSVGAFGCCFQSITLEGAGETAVYHRTLRINSTGQ